MTVATLNNPNNDNNNNWVSSVTKSELIKPKAWMGAKKKKVKTFLLTKNDDFLASVIFPCWEILAKMAEMSVALHF